MSEAPENEAALMRQCGHLYVSIALESLATTLMSLTFAYLLLLITNKGRLSNPGKAAYTFISTQFQLFVDDVKSEVSHWAEMKMLPLERRFALCRKTNQAICLFQIAVGVLTVQRWLHINNVNGFRYLGYAMTCPPMQVELIILIAPVVPCYWLNCVFTYLLTMGMLIMGYGASLIPGIVYTGSLQEFVKTWNLDDLGMTTKAWWLLPSGACQIYLSFVQIPILALLYCANGGEKAGLPHNYLKLLAIVSITWLSFPAWWYLSYEGMSIVTDTKMNAAGFTILNLISKGSFTLTMLGITKWHKKEKKRQEYLAKGIRGEVDGDEQEPDDSQRPSSRRETWVVKMLRPYDHVESGPQHWKALEPTYRAFLVGNGVNPTSWNQMSGEQRMSFREEYDSTLDMVVADDAQSMKIAGRGQQKVSSSAPPDEHVKVPVHPSGKHTSSPANMPKHEETPEEHVQHLEAISKAIKVGQTLTTVHDVKGRVVKKMGDKVQLAVKGKPSQVVQVEDLTVVKIIFLSARGLKHTDCSNKARAYCTCAIDGRPSSEVRGPLAAEASKVVWSHDETDMLGYSSGDSLLIRLWGLDSETQTEDMLGHAIVDGGELLDGGFEGELQLTADGKLIQAYVSIMVVVINLPEQPESEESGEDFMPVPRAAPGGMDGKYTHDGRPVCCF